VIALKDIQYVFTHRIWEMKGYLILLKDIYNENDLIYSSIEEIEENIAIPSAYKEYILEIKKILNR